MGSLREALTQPISLSDRRVWMVVISFLCGAVGYLLGGLVALPSDIVDREYPLPHHIPKHAGNLTLRFAMVHDVIHERFPRHGTAYYQARNDAAEQALKNLAPSGRGKDADRYFDLVDDWAVGLASLGKHQQSVELLHKKLERQQALGYEGKELYRSYANLGTVLILWQMSEGLQDAAAVRKRIKESVGWIRKAVAVNPEAHFGRETWQVVLEEFLLAALDDPELLLRFDMVGNRLDADLDPASGGCYVATKWLPGSRGPNLFPMSLRSFHSNAEQAAFYLRRPMDHDRSDLRSAIASVGAEKGWRKAATSHQDPVPFDEPALAIVGMWRLGAGANPHFAVALGEIMLRVGQRHIAWSAYERAHRLSEHIWPDKRIQDQFASRCRDRQQLIEKSLPDEDWTRRRAQFDLELALGMSYQQAYRDYEVERLGAGTPVDDAHFYDAFEAKHGPIATPVGNEDKIIVKETTYEVLPWRIWCAGILACLAAMGGTLLGRRRVKP